ncbi:Hypothetical predicted protein [Pelobates cultripes]|uniref:Uncharacterized protein n=1 Tax=Pelobates cultripes TaxID=61616 RepID=A0AAD1RDB3_PELCU|nr:Hypothetical predicted protein [Pelobates cultripes]
MAALPDHLSSSSEEDLVDAPDAKPGAEQPVIYLQLENRGALATKGDIMNLVVFRADLAVVREELTAITDRVKATEQIRHRTMQVK